MPWATAWYADRVSLWLPELKPMPIYPAFRL